jgi:hypothetical protein
MKPTQTERVVTFIRSHPEATSLEITLATGAVNVTGRVSDARAAGTDIVCVRRFDGRQGYVVVEPEPVQMALAGFQVPAT